MNLKPYNLYDMHIHTHFSGDSEALPADIANAAIAKGLAGICFTDHQDLDYREKIGLFDLDIPAYQKEIMQIKSDYEGRLDIGWGIELGLQPHIIADNQKIIDTYPFDFVIGSTHVVDHIDIYYPPFYENRIEDECYLQYFEETLINAKSDVDFDVYGHIDYVVRYGPNKNKFYTYEKFADIIDEIFRALIARGKGIELNMAGFKYGLGHAHPIMPALKRYKELGGEIITLGSDGHTPEQIAWEYEKVPAILKEAGFEYFTIFKERKPSFIKL